MAVINVTLYPPLKEKAGRGGVRAEGSTVREALEDLGRSLGSRFTVAIFEAGGVRRSFSFILNDRVVDVEKLGEIVLHDGDILQIFPPIAGG